MTDAPRDPQDPRAPRDPADKLMRAMRAQIRDTPLPDGRRRLRGRAGALVAGVSLSLGAAITALVLLLSAAESTPAFAVVPHKDGSVTVTLHAVRAISALNAKLAAEGVRVRAVPVVAGCPARVRLFPAPVPGPGPAAPAVVSTMPVPAVAALGGAFRLRRLEIATMLQTSGAETIQILHASGNVTVRVARPGHGTVTLHSLRGLIGRKLTVVDARYVQALALARKRLHVALPAMALARARAMVHVAELRTIRVVPAAVGRTLVLSASPKGLRVYGQAIAHAVPSCVAMRAVELANALSAARAAKLHR